MITTIIGLVLAVLGVNVSGVAYVLGRIVFARRFLRFGRDRIDLVATTSALQTPVSGLQVARPLTGIGQVWGIAEVARMLGLYFRRNAFKVHFSVDVKNRLNGNLIILGGGLRNDVARAFLERFRDVHPELRFVFDDESGNVQCGSVSESDFDVKPTEGIPQRDLGLVIAWKNPWSAQWRRAFLCTGLTSFGTAATAEYLCRDLVHQRTTFKGILRKSGPLLRRRPTCFVAVIEISFSHGQLRNIDERTLLRVPA